jgi:putative ubiquitin-RnfH superfamily antitoxin RatB of RatAB toxin-antitoxin module
MNIVKTRDDVLFQKKGAVGVFSIPLGPDDSIYDGDRIELYRPILIDPKKIRRKKANQNKDAELKTKAKIRKERKVLKDL